MNFSTTALDQSWIMEGQDVTVEEVRAFWDGIAVEEGEYRKVSVLCSVGDDGYLVLDALPNTVYEE